MTMTDPIADLATRIRNALMVAMEGTEVPHSKIKVGILETLKREGYIQDFQVEGGHQQGLIKVRLKYGREGEQVIRSIRRISKPGARVYRNRGALKPVLQGLGILVLSTDQGVMSDREARSRKIGGEALLEVW